MHHIKHDTALYVITCCRRGIALMSSQLIEGHAASAITVNYMQDKGSAYLVEIVVLPNAFKAPAQVASLLEGADVPSYLPEVCANMEKESNAAGGASIRRSISRDDTKDKTGTVVNMAAGISRENSSEGLKRGEFSEYHLCRLSPLSETFSLCDESEDRSEQRGKAISRVSEGEAAEAIARVSEEAEIQYAAQRRSEDERQSTVKMDVSAAATTVLAPVVETVAESVGGDESSATAAAAAVQFHEMLSALDKLLSDAAALFVKNVRFLSSYLTMCMYTNKADTPVTITVSAGPVSISLNLAVTSLFISNPMSWVV